MTRNDGWLGLIGWSFGGSALGAVMIIGLALLCSVLNSAAAHADQLVVDKVPAHGLLHESVVCSGRPQSELFVDTMRPGDGAEAIVAVNNRFGPKACMQQSVAYTGLRVEKTVINRSGVFRIVRFSVEAVKRHGRWIKVPPRKRWSYYWIPTFGV